MSGVFGIETIDLLDFCKCKMRKRLRFLFRHNSDFVLCTSTLFIRNSWTGRDSSLAFFKENVSHISGICNTISPSFGYLKEAVALATYPSYRMSETDQVLEQFLELPLGSSEQLL